MSTSSSASGPGPALSFDDAATVVVTRVVHGGREADFRGWVVRLIDASASFPNNAGSVVLSPTPGGSNAFRVVQRFTDAASLQAWEASAVRRELSVEADAFSTSQRQEASGMEAWFQVDETPGAPAPPRWKMALTTFVVVYLLTAILIPAEMAWLPRSMSFYVINIVTNVIIATLMTYVIMPAAARLLRRWLY